MNVSVYHLVCSKRKTKEKGSVLFVNYNIFLMLKLEVKGEMTLNLSGYSGCGSPQWPWLLLITVDMTRDLAMRCLLQCLECFEPKPDNNVNSIAQNLI